MASEIRVNQIQSRTGVSTVSFTDSGPIFAGISTVQGPLTVDGGVTGNVTGNVTGDITSSGTSTFDVISGVSTIGVTTVHLTGINDLNYPTAGPLSSRNVIINGAARISQRATSATGEGYKTVDRWKSGYTNTVSVVITTSQSTDSPDGFANSLKIDIDTADTFTADEEFYVEQIIEGQNVQHFAYGSSSAKDVTLSFWVKSYQTGQFSVWFYSASTTRYFMKEYTVNASATWEYKTMTIPGDTVSAIADDNSGGFSVRFYLGAGANYQGTVSTDWAANAQAGRITSSQVQLQNSTNNYWQITGVQLETGSVATPFEHINYGDELARCQRYYQEIIAGRVNTTASGVADASSRVVVILPLHVIPRVNVAHDGNGTLTKVGNITVNAFPSSTADNITGIQYFSNLGSLLTMGLNTSVSVTTGDAELVRYGSANGQKIFTLETEL